MALDPRWKLPQGKTPEHLHDCLTQLIRELRKGDYLGAISGLDADAVSFAATQRVLGRNTAGAGTGEEVTLSQLLDWIGSAAQGDILYRGASAWARLPAGTAGQVLQTQGAGANPQWASGGAALFQSAQQTITSAGSLTIAHGLSGQPQLVVPVLQCTTAEAGYSVGQELAVARLGADVTTVGGIGVPSGVAVVPDATNLNVRYANTGGNVFTGMVNFSTGATATLTNADWRLVLRAWRF